MYQNEIGMVFEKRGEYIKVRKKSVKHLNIESIAFDSCRMIVYGIDCILLEVDDRSILEKLEDDIYQNDFATEADE